MSAALISSSCLARRVSAGAQGETRSSDPQAAGSSCQHWSGRTVQVRADQRGRKRRSVCRG
eukprot:751766-Hanusia_phi.AAC.4